MLVKITVRSCMVLLLCCMMTAGALAQNLAERHTQDANEASNKEAVIEFSYTSGSLYRIYCSPGFLTDIMLKPGEEITFVGGGDTERWIIDTAKAGVGRSRVNHLYVKPVQQGIRTNLIINTTQHTYHIQLISTDSYAYNPMVSWKYTKEDQDEALKGNAYGAFAPANKTAKKEPEAVKPAQEQEMQEPVKETEIADKKPVEQPETKNKEAQKVKADAKPVAKVEKKPAVEVDKKAEKVKKVFMPDREITLDYGYTVEKKKNCPWRPVTVFNDGRKTWIEMPKSMATTSAPVLYVKEAKGNALVNYRVMGIYYVVDRLFEEAELQNGQETVAIKRVR